MDIILGAD
jgi:hypothetical protein